MYINDFTESWYWYISCHVWTWKWSFEAAVATAADDDDWTTEGLQSPIITDLYSMTEGNALGVHLYDSRLQPQAAQHKVTHCQDVFLHRCPHGANS